MKYGLSSSTPPRMSSAPSSVCSDDSFEIVKYEGDIDEPKDDVFSVYKPKVTFHEVFDVYPMDADIVAKVTFDHDYLKSDQDTVVVLPIAWKSVDQALCATNIEGCYVRFDVKDLPKIGAEDKFYQLCYCTADKIVMGVSIPFSFREVHEDELVEFQKEQNKEFWTFRSRFAVLTDNYWNALMEKQLKKEFVEKSSSNSKCGSVSVVDAAQNTSQEIEQDTTESLQTSNYFLAEAINKPYEKEVINEKGAGEPRENICDSDKLVDDMMAHKNILLFKIMKDENENIKKENQKLKALTFEIIRAVSINDRDTCRRFLNNALNDSDEIFADEEFSELRELLKKGLNEPAAVSSPDKKTSISFTNVLSGDEPNNELKDLSEPINEKILLFKIMENENAELKVQFEEEQILHADTKNTVKDLKDILIEILSTTSLQERVYQTIENSLPFISAAFNDQELDQVRELLKKSGTEALNEMAESQLGKFEAAFVGTSDGNILLTDQCDKQTSIETVTVAKLTEERDNLLAQVDEQHAIIKNLNEQLINQRQSEVEKMITVTNNMRDQYMKNMNKLTDSNNVMTNQLTEKDKEIEVLNSNLLDASRLLTENEREIRNLKALDHTFVGFLERRNLKTISELRETLQVKIKELIEKTEMYSKRWVERQESAKLKEDLLTTQTLLNSLCDELEKSGNKKSMENSAQTNDEVGNVNDASSTSSSESPVPEILSTSAGFRRIKQREQALAKKLVEMTAELEKMRIIQDKTKTELETRLKDGAKLYAKLYVKYDKLLKRSQIPSCETSN